MSKQRVREIVAGILSRIEAAHVQGLVDTYGPGAADPRVRIHAERFATRLEVGAAYRLALALVEDAAHRACCPICAVAGRADGQEGEGGEPRSDGGGPMTYLGPLALLPQFFSKREENTISHKEPRT